MKFNIEIPDELLFAAIEKHPKEPWDRFASRVNNALGTSYDEMYIRAAKSVAEWQFDLGHKKCKRIDERTFTLIRAALKSGKSHHEIAEFAGVSPSTVSRIERVGVNLEFRQIQEMRRIIDGAAA
ncbi:hypothetical protein ACFOHK_08410 [Falsigemmobacter intermedius]|uniref:XRE family transcriptional regulator n=1 Tax=Falsigemmobacter intermedius TaxID=1553448 RepID=A0A451GGQ2_9RHOB|nr:helix-turn-helix transcriptional regulator [Falsigemmobacter intermedius]RWY36392.1 XRE family transcriptional regulator [Falsigemmobacter intermedius]